ncbi:hypothetical protein GCM10018790_63910 [Kitasatospora xanthocidica]|nr:hypothetical protein GCM10018790_63910 [Kitasatospora xanthocidica]
MPCSVVAWLYLSEVDGGPGRRWPVRDLLPFQLPVDEQAQQEEEQEVAGQPAGFEHSAQVMGMGIALPRTSSRSPPSDLRVAGVAGRDDGAAQGGRSHSEPLRMGGVDQLDRCCASSFRGIRMPVVRRT